MTPSFSPRSPLSLGRRRFEITDEEPLGPPAPDALEAPDDRPPPVEDFDLEPYSDDRAPYGSSTPAVTAEAPRPPAHVSSAGPARLLSAAALAVAGLALVTALHTQRLERPPTERPAMGARKPLAPHAPAGESSASVSRQPRERRRATAGRRSRPRPTRPRTASDRRRSRPRSPGAGRMPAPAPSDEPHGSLPPPSSTNRVHAPTARPAVGPQAAPSPRRIAPTPSKPAGPAPTGNGSPRSAAPSPGDPEFGFPP
jgi:hypothetical protein